MGIISSMRKQKAVYWAPGGFGVDGTPTLGTPIQIDCRWEDTHEQFMNASGELQTSLARVYVDRTLELGGMLWEGLVAAAPADPRGRDSDAWEIRRFERLPDLRNKETLLTAML